MGFQYSIEIIPLHLTAFPSVTTYSKFFQYSIEIIKEAVEYCKAHKAPGDFQYFIEIIVGSMLGSMHATVLVLFQYSIEIIGDTKERKEKRMFFCFSFNILLKSSACCAGIDKPSKADCLFQYSIEIIEGNQHGRVNCA